jgi:hypothetical protein
VLSQGIGSHCRASERDKALDSRCVYNLTGATHTLKFEKCNAVEDVLLDERPFEQQARKVSI